MLNILLCVLLINEATSEQTNDTRTNDVNNIFISYNIKKEDDLIIMQMFSNLPDKLRIYNKKINTFLMYE